jgi:hypothetical protein
MINKRILLIVSLVSIAIGQTYAQIASASDDLIAQPPADRLVLFAISDNGAYKPIIWGLDLAWLSEANLRRGIAFMGADRVDVVRSSFMPTDEIVNNELTGDALTNTKLRIQRINQWLSANTQVMLNSDHPSVNSWYKNANGTAIASRWAQLMDITARYHQEAGRTIVTVSPFNEPDYWQTGQGTIQDFYSIAADLRQNWPRFNDIRISGGNTLNPDFAKEWYDYLQVNLDEGNTHQLAGSFDNYAGFFEHVRANGDHATADELHNTMEAMVGVEYGMQTGVWWGTAEYCRSEFVKASDGVRLAYAEHRPNWTAASVYRTQEGKIKAFGGTSERQATTTTYKFISKDQVVYYDGHGPQRAFVLVLPGGTGYQQGQTNAERVVNVTWGEDIQPVINGRYKLVNRKSGMVMEVAGGTAGANVRQGSYTGDATQQWDVTPVDTRIGGDFSYYSIKPASNANMSLDLLNFSLDNGANIHQWNAGNGSNQQWYLEYVEDGWFYIRSRESSYCLEVANGSTTTGANIGQWEKKGEMHQQWRLLASEAAIEFKAPSAITELTIKSNPASIILEWPQSLNLDVAGYTIFRKELVTGTYNTIARNVTALSFVDNTVISGVDYFYKIKVVDQSLNHSEYSNEVSATTTGLDGLIAHYSFDQNTQDSSINLNHGAASVVSYSEGMFGTKSITMDGSKSFIQLPSDVANHASLSVATWVKWNGGMDNQRIFDFGNGDSEYIMLSPGIGSKLHFEINVNGTKKVLDAPKLSVGEWMHVAITMDADNAYLYVNGSPVDISINFGLSPRDIKPMLNYIGQSQAAVPLFNGSIDEFRVYNYALDPSEVEMLADTIQSTSNPLSTDLESGKELKIWPNPANNVLKLRFTPRNPILFLH